MSAPTMLEGTIQSAGDEIYQQLTQIVDSSIEDRVEEWCKSHGLLRLDNPLQIVARQAVFNVLLKATLHEHYHQRGHLPELGSDARQALNDAEELTGDPAFKEYILDEVAWLKKDALNDVLAARNQLQLTDDPAEEIGRIFEGITPQKSRRKLGQFRTPKTIADLMADWLIKNGSETVLDPGMGACALSAAVYREKQEKKDEPSLSDIHGIDLDELALVMGATTLTLMDHGNPHSLCVGDFLELEVNDLDGEVDAVISNPPYSRHHELSEEYKSRVNSQAEHELGRDVSALSPMYAYFYYHAAQFLKPGGRMSFITPSEYLETSYGESLKQFLLDEFDINALVLFDRNDDSKFEEAMTTSLVSFLEKTKGTDDNELTRIVRVDGNPSEEELLAAVTGDVEGETEWGFVNAVRQSELESEEKWTVLFDPVDIDTSELTPLSELATVNRGIATGKNEYFCLTQSEVDEWGIDEQYLSKIIRNSRSVPGYDYTDEDWQEERDAGREVWLLYHITELNANTISQSIPDAASGNETLTAYSSDESENVEVKNPGLVEYLQFGMSDEIEAHDGYLARNRNPWFVVDRRDPPPIVLTYMSRNGTRFIRNETNARNLSNLHGMYIDVEMDETQLKALLAYLNSEFASKVVRRSGRTYSSGMDKIEPNEMEGVPVLDPRGLNNETVGELAALFDELREAARDDALSTAEVVLEIDKLLQEVFDK
ncbi:N-6 DNA methylase [Halodesulfurarchaeum sp. HSR-GB]|uniref:HsdM family class I SAM-dependent methyltransferase n=1 Tax=Halodesulfurarchaeum sp. HSR-GB TaxID=3074077 RepID=UPI002864DF4F|nr:N-6 DNA methylase [Halodesulfurarchaeum sp. HSR-GB]MDR5657739.1 N-6 DNA methylase [Halodesulfurarchaeum sp. HSR-GB]